MSKGDGRRPEDPDKEPGAYQRHYDQIEWPNRPTFFESLKPLDRILEEANRRVDDAPKA